MGIGVVILVARDGEWERLCVCVCRSERESIDRVHVETSNRMKSTVTQHCWWCEEYFFELTKLTHLHTPLFHWNALNTVCGCQLTGGCAKLCDVTRGYTSHAWQREKVLLAKENWIETERRAREIEKKNGAQRKSQWKQNSERFSLPLAVITVATSKRTHNAIKNPMIKAVV